MKQPPLDELLKKVENKYSLVVKTAKRARQIAENQASHDNMTSKGKPVTLALFEIVNQANKSEDSNEL